MAVNVLFSIHLPSLQMRENYLYLQQNWIKAISMKLLVCISSTPETTAEIKFSDDSTQFLDENVNYIMNPYDEWYALVRALELKEQNGGEVILIHVGESSNDKIIRKGLAIGADKAVRINSESKSAMFVAHQIAAYAKSENVDIVFTGKETLDYNSSEVGGMIAELLDMPFISYACKMDNSENTFTIEREIEGGIEKVELNAPFVISASKGLAQQRIPNMRGIMMAKRKPLDVVEPIEAPAMSEIELYIMPEAKQGVKMIDPANMDELVRLLHEEAKVI